MQNLDIHLLTGGTTVHHKRQVTMAMKMEDGRLASNSKEKVYLSGEECSTQPYVCVDQIGQSRTRLNVLHADAVPRHRPSDDQLARMYDYYYSQS
jgi:hypothetical protein